MWSWPWSILFLSIFLFSSKIDATCEFYDRDERPDDEKAERKALETRLLEAGGRAPILVGLLDTRGIVARSSGSAI